MRERDLAKIADRVGEQSERDIVARLIRSREYDDVVKTKPKKKLKRRA